MHFFRLRHALQQQHHGAAHSRYVNGLVGCVQNQHRFLHQGSAPGSEAGTWRPPTFPEAAGTSVPPASGECRPRWSTASGRLALIAPSLPATVCRRRACGRPARATVRPNTDLAPASRSAREHASSVAPVVITSSSSKTRKLSTRPPLRMAKAPRTDSHRSSQCSRCFSGRGRVRISSTGRYGRLKPPGQRLVQTARLG